MKTRNSARLYYLCSIFVLAAFATTSLLEYIPVSSASTDSNASVAPKRKGFFRRSSSSTKEYRGKDTSSDDKDNSEVVEETKPGQRFSWQSFYRKKEVAEKDQKQTEQESADELEEGQNKEEEVKNKESEGEDVDVEDGEIEQYEENDNQEDITTKSENPSSTSGSNDDKKEEDDAKNIEKTGGENNDGEEEPDAKQSEESGEKESSSSPAERRGQDPMQLYRNQLMQQQSFLSPGAIIYRSAPSMTSGNPMPRQQQQPGTPAQGQALAAAAVINLVSLASRFFFLKWVINKLAFDSESKSPVQHFMWECLNDKFIRDDEIWNRVLKRRPYSMGVSQRKWKKTVKNMGPDSLKDNHDNKKNGNNQLMKKDRNKKKSVSKIEKEDQQPTESNPTTTPGTSKTVVVMDFSTMNVAQPDFLRFADVVTFLVSSNNPKKKMFGKKPEIILTLQSPGGEVTSFAFAAAQVVRLRDAGWKVTVCVDRIAASGGYMIASQATQILASPFAMVGSVGVITESLNFHEILKKNGIQSLVLKAGDSKNPITQFGEVTDEDVKTTQKDLDETHESFIDLCRSRRPTLDPAVCNGRILSGEKAIESGMIDRILTSDEYILEKISEGDLVMKLHLVSGNRERYMVANALQILPHLKSKFQNFLYAGGNDSLVGKLNSVMDGSFASKVIQIVGLTSMIRRAITRNGRSCESLLLSNNS